MKFEASAKYAGPRDRVREVLLSEELANARAKALKVPDAQFSSTGETSTMTVAVSAEQLPQAARKFLSKGVKVTIVASAQESGSATNINHDIKIEGAPAAVSLLITLTDAGGATAGAATGDVKVSIPLMGSKIEKQVVDRLQRVLDRDTKLVNSLL